MKPNKAKDFYCFCFPESSLHQSRYRDPLRIPSKQNKYVQIRQYSISVALSLEI